MALLVFYLLVALVISFLCSLMESVLLSTPATYLRANENTENSGARKLALYKNRVERPLSAILSLNTVAHTVGAAGVGAQASVVFGEAYFGVVSAILTILILVLTEIIPKTIGANFWRRLGGVTGHMLRVTIFITYPLVVLSAFLTRLISKGKSETTTSREELSALAKIGTEEGIFREEENKIIQNLMRLNDVKVSEILTPRIVVTLANEEMTLKEFLVDKDYLRFSRIPVYSGNQDNITGYVIRQTVLENIAHDRTDMKLGDMKKKIQITPQSKTVIGVWEQLLDSKEHIALVVDEYGGMDGIVTMEDIIESLLGFEIVDEKDTITDMQTFARERWKQRQAKYELMYTEAED